MTHPDLLTREEAARLLRVSVRRLEDGWGPPPLLDYGRPKMYSRAQCDEWLESRRRPLCSTDAATSGGPNSSTRVTVSGSQQARQIAASLRRERVRFALKSNSQRGPGNGQGST